ncbi:LuxR C-terminal-related transcriptional regulator [Lutibacter sp.]|uniref:LuxR C-terminal-related transcriptional regulator n=1 Tax=Lutibacter sp. TaxID=1925666 RepID=UPI0025B8FF2F|nr:LuxR C-terminal-related transcriptional regulator [Lutibacter sp.]MCF6181187.1 LuxR C-terminal-related transcriptional regulator [Lutibacter sp.]
MKKIVNIRILKMTIFQKLLIGIIAMLILNIVIAYIGIVSTDKLDKNSTIILKESQKNKNLQELKLSFTELLMPANDYLIHGNKVEILNFKKLDSITNLRLKNCLTLENNHFNEHFLEEIETILYKVKELSYKIFYLKNPIGNKQGAIMMEVMDNNIATVGKKIDILSESSSLLISKYRKLNEELRSSSSKSIIILVLIIMTSLIVGGFYYVKEITIPIDILASAAKKIASGNLTSKVKITTRTQDELNSFAKLFNNMIESLSQNMVSKDFFNSIIQKIDEILIITDVNRKILIVNKAALNLLEYQEKELIGKSIDKILLGENKKETITSKEESVQNIYNTYYSKSNIAIPVSFSKTNIFDKEKNKTGVLYIAYHKTNSLNKKDSRSKYNSANKIKLTSETPLTNRELEIVKLIIKEYSNQKIADKLFISIRTVETHRKHIMEKLHAKSVVGLVHYAIQNGLL